MTGHLAWAPVVLFALIFIWTPPHFWALAIRYRDDYRAAHVPMLPAVASMRATAVQILAYTVALLAVSLLFAVVGHMGLLYVVVAVVAGLGFCLHAVQLLRAPSAKAAMRVFHYSITYLSVLFLAMALDVVVRSH